MTENAIGESLGWRGLRQSIVCAGDALRCKYGHHLESLEKLLDAAANVDEDTIYSELMATAAALGIAVPALRKVKAKDLKNKPVDEAQSKSIKQIVYSNHI